MSSNEFVSPQICCFPMQSDAARVLQGAALIFSRLIEHRIALNVADLCSKRWEIANSRRTTDKNVRMQNACQDKQSFVGCDKNASKSFVMHKQTLNFERVDLVSRAEDTVRSQSESVAILTSTKTIFLSDAVKNDAGLLQGNKVGSESTSQENDFEPSAQPSNSQEMRLSDDAEPISNVLISVQLDLAPKSKIELQVKDSITDQSEKSDEPSFRAPAQTSNDGEKLNVDQRILPTNDGPADQFSFREEDLPQVSSPNQKPSVEKRESSVPSGQLARVANFAGLGIGLAVGTLGELARQAVSGGLGSGSSLKNLVLNERNSERLTLALCRMRGAALKLGQLLSIQDEHVLPKDSPLRAVIDRVREEAENMPPRQLYQVLREELGSDWRSRLAAFSETPLASASIGQVHRGVTADGMPVAIKVQYPGVADSIDSDVESLKTFVAPLMPRGLFFTTALASLKESMVTECDYVAEASATQRMRELLSGDEDFRVPRVVAALSARRVVTTELLPGVPVDRLQHAPQLIRDRAAALVLRLTLRELFEFHLVQTDPNWSNFLYDEKAGVLGLIDFGATVEYSQEFCHDYASLVKASVDGDAHEIIRISRQMGFLTGEESNEFLSAHVAAAKLTAEPFSTNGNYDFGAANLTDRMSPYLNVMLAGRLTPPPRPVYTLHRKLSGAFLTCIRLKAKISSRQIFLDAWNKHCASRAAPRSGRGGLDGEYSEISASPAP